MWSATAGFILSGKINKASVEDEDGTPICWGVGQYFQYGVINYLIQISLALAMVALVL